MATTALILNTNITEMTSVLTLLILSQWAKVYSKVSVNLLRMLQNQLANVFQSKMLAARQAGELLSAPPGSCILGCHVPFFFYCVCLWFWCFPLFVGVSKQGMHEGKEAAVPQASPYLLCPLGGAGMQPRAPGKAGSTDSDLHEYLLFRLFPHSPWPPCSMDRTCFWSCTAFKSLSFTYHSLTGILSYKIEILLL